MAAEDGTFCRKKYVFYKMKCTNSSVVFKKHEKTFFSATSVQSLFKAIEQKSDTKKACFLLFFPNFFQIFLTTLHFKFNIFSLFLMFWHDNLLDLDPESLKTPENWAEIEDFLQKLTILSVFSHFLWDILKCFRKKR